MISTSLRPSNNPADRIQIRIRPVHRIIPILRQTNVWVLNFRVKNYGEVLSVRTHTRRGYWVLGHQRFIPYVWHDRCGLNTPLYLMYFLGTGIDSDFPSLWPLLRYLIHKYCSWRSLGQYDSPILSVGMYLTNLRKRSGWFPTLLSPYIPPSQFSDFVPKL